jgi:hypothetical protein
MLRFVIAIAQMEAEFDIGWYRVSEALFASPI